MGYGSLGAARAIEQLRGIMAEVMVAGVRTQVALSLFTDFENFSVFKPSPHHENTLETVLNQVVVWSGALKNYQEIGCL